MFPFSNDRGCPSLPNVMSPKGLITSIGERVTLESVLTLAGGQKIGWVYKQNFTGRVTLQLGTT